MNILKLTDHPFVISIFFFFFSWCRCGNFFQQNWLLLVMLFIYSAVKGLQILATFSESFFPVSKSIYDNILSEFVRIVLSDSNKTFLWTLTLKALTEIGYFVNKCPESEKSASFESIVVEKIVSLLPSGESVMPLSLKLEAAFEIGGTRKDFMFRVVHGLSAAIYTNFSAAYVSIYLSSCQTLDEYVFVMIVLRIIILHAHAFPSCLNTYQIFFCFFKECIISGYIIILLCLCI